MLLDVGHLLDLGIEGKSVYNLLGSKELYVENVKYGGI